MPDVCKCTPGELMVRFTPQVTATEVEKLNADYGFEWERLYVRPPYQWGVLKVPQRQERFWMALLESQPFVSSVEPRKTRTLGASMTLWLPPVPTASAKVASGSQSFAQRLRGFVRGQFGDTQHRLVPLGSNLLQVEIAEVKGEVIRQNEFWEKIVMHLVFEPVEPPRMHLLVEGWYAPGLGGRAPEQNAYRSMQPKYTESLREYVALTQTRINQYLESEQTQ